MENKQKQIEEMASCLIGKEVTGSDSTKVLQLGYVTVREISEILYNADYRKIPKNARVIIPKDNEKFVLMTMEDHEALLLEQKRLKEIVDRIPCGYELKEKTRKETAEKFAERLKGLLEEREYKAGCSAHMMWTDTAKSCVDEVLNETLKGE